MTGQQASRVRSREWRVPAGVDLARWVDQAACADRPDLPWITDAEQIARADQDAMQAVCARCPVLTRCRDAADRLHASAGYWAGNHRDTTDPVLVEAEAVVQVEWTSAAAGRGWEQAALAWPTVDGAA